MAFSYTWQAMIDAIAQKAFDGNNLYNIWQNIYSLRERFNEYHNATTGVHSAFGATSFCVLKGGGDESDPKIVKSTSGFVLGASWDSNATYTIQTAREISTNMPIIMAASQPGAICYPTATTGEGVTFIHSTYAGGAIDDIPSTQYIYFAAFEVD